MSIITWSKNKNIIYFKGKERNFEKSFLKISLSMSTNSDAAIKSKKFMF